MEVKEKKAFGCEIGPIPTLIYCPDFITDAEQTQLLNNIYQAPISKWKTLKNRRLQNWGGVVHEKGLISQELPSWLSSITQRIHDKSGIFPKSPNHVLINEYYPDQGIMPHQDGPSYYPAASILSLGTPVVMNFTPHSKFELANNIAMTISNETSNSHDREDSNSNNGNPQSFSLVLMPRSLLIFKDLAYSDYLHGIEDTPLQHYGGAVNLSEYMSQEMIENWNVSPGGEVLHRTGTRISLTCRLVLKVHKNLLKF